MTKKLLIFGTGSVAEVAHFYFTHDTPYEVVAFTAHGDRIERDNLFGLPVLPFEEIHETHPPDEHQMFVAIGYTGVNRLRAGIYFEAKAMGYDFATYVSSKCTHWGDISIGENSFIFEQNNIQPFVTIGNNVIMWSGNHVGHHSRIGDHCFVTSHVVISGHVRIEPYCFLGVNATLRDDISIGEACVIGAGAVIMRSTNAKELYVPERTRPDERTTDQIRF